MVLNIKKDINLIYVKIKGIKVYLPIYVLISKKEKKWMEIDMLNI